VGKSAESPDPYATAAAQTSTNEATARVQAKLNNPSTIGPTGTVTNTWNPDDTVTQTTQLSDGQQKLFDAVQGSETSSTQRMQDLLNTGIDLSGLTDWANSPSTSGMVTSVPGAGQGRQSSIGPTADIRTDYSAGTPMQTGFSTGQHLDRMGTQDYGQQRKAVEDAIMSRVQPQYDRQRDTLNANLAAQGFNVNTKGYQNAADESNRNLTDARMQAVLAGGQEQSRLAGLDQSRLGFNNAASQAETQAYNTGLGLQNVAGQQNNQNWNDMVAGYNTAAGQQYNQAQGRAAFTNAAQEQAYNQAIQSAGFTNTAQQQQYNQQAQNADRQNALRNQQFTQALQLRSQPINEVSSLFGLGNQISIPGAQQYSGGAIQPANYAQLVQNKYSADSANATSTNNAAASAAATAAMAAMLL
jgi:hypothetical protein